MRRTIAIIVAMTAFGLFMAQSAAPATKAKADNPAPFIWTRVGGDPFVPGGVNDKNIASVLDSPRARACAAKEHIPSAVWKQFVTDARKNPKSLHGTMKTNASFDAMAFGADCKAVGKTWYTGSPVSAFNKSYTYRGTLWTLTLPFGCGNIAVTMTRVPAPRVIIKKVEVPRSSKMSVAIMYAKSNSASKSEAQTQCPTGTVAAQATAGAWAYAYAKAIGFGFGDAQRRAYAYAIAKTATSTSTSVICNVPASPLVPSPPPTPPAPSPPPPGQPCPPGQSLSNGVCVAPKDTAALPAPPPTPGDPTPTGGGTDGSQPGAGGAPQPGGGLPPPPP